MNKILSLSSTSFYRNNKKMDVSDGHISKTIRNRFKEINYDDGLRLINDLINNYNIKIYNIIDIIRNLSENKNENIYEILKYIYENKPELNIYTNLEFTTVIHATASNNNVELLKDMFDDGVDINYKDVSEYTPLMEACLKENYAFDSIKFLVENNADINYVCTHIDAEDGQYCALSLLIKKCEDSNIEQLLEIIEYLLNSNADPNIKIEYPHDDSLLINVITNTKINDVNKIRIMNLLVSKGANINIRDYENNSLLMKVFKISKSKHYFYNDDHKFNKYIKSMKNMIMYLMRNGADTNICNMYDENVFDIIEKEEHMKIIRMYIDE